MVFDEFLSGLDGGASRSTKKKSKNNNGADGRILAVYPNEGKGWQVTGRTGGFGVYSTKKDAKRAARNVFNKDDKYTRYVVLNKDGSIQKVKGGSKASIRRENPFFLRHVLK